MTVVVGYIPGEFGEAALSAGVAEARLRNTRLVVVNASKGDALVDPRYVGDEGLRSLEERLTETGLDHEVRQRITDDVAEQIVAVAEEVDADLIVLGLRHRTPVGKLIMGSVAQRVLLDSHCAVLAVKPARH